MIWLPIRDAEASDQQPLRQRPAERACAHRILWNIDRVLREVDARADARDMRTYVLRRLLQTIPLLLGISR